MPLYEYQCENCSHVNEVIVFGDQLKPVCEKCNSQKMKKLISVSSSNSGILKNKKAALNEASCCGSLPGEASDCFGPGSCCGRDSSHE